MRITIHTNSAACDIDTLGAEPKSLTDLFGREYLWQGDPAYWGRTAPVLFPIIGNLKDNKTLFEGKEYTIPKHGFARDTEFKCIYHKDNKAVFCLNANEKTKEMFPFDFTFQVSYTLEDVDLHVEYTVFNNGDTPMPFCLGAHPAFRCPGEEEKFEEYQLCFPTPQTIHSPVFNTVSGMWEMEHRLSIAENQQKVNLDYELFRGDTILCEHPDFHRIALVNERTGRGVELRWEGFTDLAIWSPYGKNAPFVCLEPWCGAAKMDNEPDEEFVHKRGVQVVQPMEQKKYSMTILPL